MEKAYIYNLLTKGSDGRFVISAYGTKELAEKALEDHVAAQKELDGLGTDIYIDRHKYDRPILPEIIVRPEDILSWITVNTRVGDKIVKTERYIIRIEIK